MSWSVNYIGTPQKISEALTKQSATLSGKSKEEFDAALPHLLGLLAQNYNKNVEPVISLSSSGHGHDGYNNRLVTLTHLGGSLV